MDIFPQNVNVYFIRVCVKKKKWKKNIHKFPRVFMFCKRIFCIAQRSMQRSFLSMVVKHGWEFEPWRHRKFWSSTQFSLHRATKTVTLLRESYIWAVRTWGKEGVYLGHGQGEIKRICHGSWREGRRRRRLRRKIKIKTILYFLRKIH